MAQSDDATNGANAHPGVKQDINLPPIAAAFLVKFDNRKGYTLAWHRASEDVDIEGVVEFKSLPSGLHKVKEDLVYFTHEQCAGISAFINREDDQDSRNARMLAVGVMVPIETGRMGKSWLHAEGLKELAEKQIEKQDEYTLLEEYWEKHKIPDDVRREESPDDFSNKQRDLSIKTSKETNGYRKSRAMSIGVSVPGGSHTLSAYHPASALMDLLHTFGPLVFPLFRAALLRKRILLLGEAPVARSCNFVYNLSILSSLTRDVAASLPLDDTADLRLQPLFNIGISDIPMLEGRASEQGWIACTTDDVLCTKPDLFDLLVILPSAETQSTSLRRFPKIIQSSPELSKEFPKTGLRASQRDVRRYLTLWKGIRFIPASLSPAQETAVADGEESDTTSIKSSASSTFSRTSIIEPQSWSRIAYTSLIWWATAGDKRAGLSEAEENEVDQDATLLDFQDPDDEAMGEDDEAEAKTKEVVVVTYFHRLTTIIVQILGDAIARTDANVEGEDERYRDEVGQHDGAAPDSAEDQDEAQSESHDQQDLLSGQNRSDSDDQPPVQITQDDVTNMGLQVWSTPDQKFIEEMVSFWWDREAVVQGGRIECCGIRIL